VEGERIFATDLRGCSTLPLEPDAEAVEEAVA
jgi:hypothetical protein